MCEKRKTKRKCPLCDTELEKKTENGFQLLCSTCGDVTINYYLWDIINLYKEKANEIVDDDDFQYDRKCTNCFSEYSHPINFCNKCGMSVRKIIPKITYGQWFSYAKDITDKRHRILKIINRRRTFSLFQEIKTYNEQADHYIEIIKNRKQINERIKNAI